jgi:hypothetical protein
MVVQVVVKVARDQEEFQVEMVIHLQQLHLKDKMVDLAVNLQMGEQVVVVVEQEQLVQMQDQATQLVEGQVVLVHL